MIVSSTKFLRKKGNVLGSKFMAAVMVVVMSAMFGIPSSPSGAYTFSQTRKESPKDFNEFLDDCTLVERVQMLQVLKDLPKLKDEYFGKLRSLPALESYTDKSRKPSTFNEVLPDTVIDAMTKGIISSEALSTSAVRKALVWRAYNKTTYYFRGDSEVDYHGIVQWVAGKSGVTQEQVKTLPTFSLENKVIEKYFEMVWEKLTYDQRAELLKQLEKESGIRIDVASISTMGGAAALATLQGVVIAYGLPTVMGSIAAWIVSVIVGNGWLATLLAALGYGSGWLTGMLTSGLGALVTGPIGLTVTASIVAGGVFMMGSAEKETVSAFVMSVGLIKAKKYLNMH
ncbi:MAG: hypothetical protein IJR98_02865 [Synergistaceae bacterium]|nr:hypothetical protein [Synergistaceae bacterium]